MVRALSTGVAPSIIVAVRTLPWWLRYYPARVLFLDDFEGTLKWEQYTGTVTKETVVDAFEASSCLKLLTGATAGDTCEARVNLGGVSKSKMALQLRWHALNALEATLRSFMANVRFYDGVTQYSFSVRYLNYLTTSQKKWQYYDPTGTWTDIPLGSQDLPTTSRLHNYLRMLFDVSRTPPALLSFEFNALLLTPPPLTAYSAADSTTPRIILSAHATTDAAAASTCFVDAVCLSDQEP